MKTRIIFFSFIIFIISTSCVSNKHTEITHIRNIDSTHVASKLYEVYKIDSINNYYLIYLRKDSQKYKVVSKMEYVPFGKKIKLGTKYDFSLESLFDVDISINGINVNPAHTSLVECIYVDKMTYVCIERNDSIFDLFRAKNLTGLYIHKAF
ncbi:hypothetical protein [Bacteroides sp. 519]|uniref:hypothetical protein n=1 Tax=Bacteroides sp. 519 TaxID=2302937 RepID=UPI00194026B6|nr:hypothetical protein [Bacteroides sp. 519]NDV57679.1 hypothetical protein [Bacteroides sp. 519]